jgi:hypothetical protein
MTYEVSVMVTGPPVISGGCNDLRTQKRRSSLDGNYALCVLVPESDPGVPVLTFGSHTSFSTQAGLLYIYKTNSS